MFMSCFSSSSSFFCLLLLATSISDMPVNSYDILEIHRRITENIQCKVSCGDTGRAQPLCCTVAFRMALRRIHKNISCMESCSTVLLRSEVCIVDFCLAWRFFCYIFVFSAGSTLSRRKRHVNEKWYPV